MNRGPSLKEIEPGLSTIVFDFDGVLVESDDLHCEAYRRAFSPHGIEFGLREYLAGAKGHGRAAVVDQFGASLGQEARRDVAGAKAVEARKLVEEGRLELVPGARRFIESARSRGLRCAVASTSVLAPFALEVLGCAGDFDTICATRKGERPKPHPDVYLRAFRELEEEPTRCLVIEDTPVGATAGREAGAPVAIRGDVSDWSSEPILAEISDFFVRFASLHEALGWGVLGGGDS